MVKSFKRIFSILSLAAVASAVALGQTVVETKRTEVVKNPDGTYTVIEYPVGKEVTLNLTPATVVGSAKGSARVMRSADGTKVYFDVSGVPAGTSSFHAYAVDPTGTPAYLGPVSVTDGVGTGEFSTSMNQFMLVLSPNEGLTGITPSNVVFTSDIPTGYAVVPRRVSERRVVAQVAGVSRSAYDVPLLNVPTFGEAEREVKMKFGGELTGLEGKAYIDREKGVTKIKMHFDDLKKVPANKQFTLWTYSPDGQYTKLGQIISSGKRNEARIQSETALTDFGLFITAEDSEVTVPTSRVYSVFTVNP